MAKLDRLSRNVDDVRHIVKVLSRKIVFCDIPSDGEADIMMITLFAAFAEREREMISLRTKQAIKVKKEREGSWHLKNPKWQKQQEEWFQSGNITKLAITANIKKAANNENNIRATQLVIAKREEGLSFAKIAELLNSSKFTASEGGAFTGTQVMRLLKRNINKNQIAA